MYGSVSRSECSISSGVCSISFEKASPGIWHLFITGPINSAIDPKSYYILALVAEAEGRLWEAWSLHQQAAALGHPHAQVLVGTSLLSAENAYGADRDVKRAIAILGSFLSNRRSSGVTLILADALVQDGNVGEARRLLEAAADQSDDVRMRLVRLLEESFPNEAGVALEHREIVAAAGTTEGMHPLGERGKADAGPKGDGRAGVGRGTVAIGVSICTVAAVVATWFWRRKQT
jgi:hypothetical protein